MQLFASKLAQLSGINYIFYSSGTPDGFKSSIRKSESLPALISMGVSPNNIHFFGSKHKIPEVCLIAHMERASLLLLNFLSKFTNGFHMYAPAWEGVFRSIMLRMQLLWWRRKKEGIECNLSVPNL